MLHSILLGPYKYLLSDVMKGLTRKEKGEILARVSAFNYSGFEHKLAANVCYHHQSFLGRDYKTWAIFIIGPYLSSTSGDKEVWLSLSQVSIAGFLPSWLRLLCECTVCALSCVYGMH